MTGRSILTSTACGQKSKKTPTTPSSCSRSGALVINSPTQNRKPPSLSHRRLELNNNQQPSPAIPRQSHEREDSKHKGESHANSEFSLKPAKHAAGVNRAHRVCVSSFVGGPYASR